MKKSLIIILLFLVTISWMSWGAFVIYFDEFELFKFVFFLFLLGVTFLVLQNLNFLRAKHEIGLFRSQFLFGIKCVLIFFIFAVLHYLNSFQPWSIDLTFQKLYKVRDEGLELTKNLAKKQKIEFTFWGTREHWNQAEELLGNYKKASSHVKLQWINPDQKPEMAKMIEGRQLPLLHIVFGDKKKWVENIDEWNINFALNALRDKKNSGLCFLASHQTLSLDDESTMGLSYLKTLIQSEGFRVHTIGLDDSNTLETCHAFMLMGPQDGKND